MQVREVVSECTFVGNNTCDILRPVANALIWVEVGRLTSKVENTKEMFSLLRSIISLMFAWALLYE